MYSTKRFHGKAEHDYLAVGDNYVDPYVVQSDRYRNKQFQTNSTKSGQTEGYFSQYKHSADIYSDNNGYIESQPLDSRPRGFGTSDAKKRDEFTLNIKSLQYKELLSHEQKYQKTQKNSIFNLTNTNENINTVNQPEIDTQKHYQFAVPKTLYDIGRSQVTPTCLKCSRDTFYCKHRVQLSGSDNESARYVGTYKTTTQELGSLVDSSKIQVPKVKSVGSHRNIASFYDNTHLSASQRL